MKPTEILKRDHDVVRALFKRYEDLGDNSSAAKKETYQKVERELSAHAQLEEALFYPALKGATGETQETPLREAFEEHRLVKQLLRELSEMTPGEASFDAKFKVLRENVEHHAEEEERELFAMTSEMDPSDFRELGRTMAAYKRRQGLRIHPRRDRLKNALERVKTTVSRTVNRVRHRVEAEARAVANLRGSRRASRRKSRS